MFFFQVVREQLEIQVKLAILEHLDSLELEVTLASRVLLEQLVSLEQLDFLVL